MYNIILLLLQNYIFDELIKECDRLASFISHWNGNGWLSPGILDLLVMIDLMYTV